MYQEMWTKLRIRLSDDAETDMLRLTNEIENEVEDEHLPKMEAEQNEG